MKALIALYKKCKKSDSIFLLVMIRYLYIRLIYKQNLFLHQNVRIKGVKNIEAKERVDIGLNYVGFVYKTDKTFLNISGKLKFKGQFNVGRGCRFDIGENAIVEIGNPGYINCNTFIIIMHSLKIGDNCAISWNCQFLDEDFHVINYSDKKPCSNSIDIGNNVWIGCGVKIYKGTAIGDGCIIASDSVVKGCFPKKNCLIGGNPAKVLKENVSWDLQENPSFEAPVLTD